MLPILALSRPEFVEFGKSFVGNKTTLFVFESNAFIPADRCGSHDYNEWANLEPSTLADTATEEDYKTYRTLLLNTLQYAIDRLNQKAVYSNVIVFCAKIFGTLHHAWGGPLLIHTSTLTPLYCHSTELF